MKLKLILPVFLLASSIVLSQNQSDIWYFGYNAGMNFSSGSPVPISGGQINAYEGCAVQCDPASGLLTFYTDGIFVWDKNHNQMPNGFDLYGDNFSSASALIIPKPGNAALYYIFTASGIYGLSPGTPVTTLHYSIVDITLNGGLGDVTTKNTLLLDPSAEKLTAVYQCNGVDVWVIAHQLNSNAFYAYLVTSAGISAPVVSSVGGINLDGKGYMKASPNGKKIGLAANSEGGGIVQLFDFDAKTGMVSNPISLPPDNCNYGVSFSPDNSKFYVTGFEACYSEDLFQYDVSSGVAATIIASKTYIATDIYFGSLQNAPDGKMYVALDFMSWLGVINNPNAAGTACNYVSVGPNLGAYNTSSHGLPYFIESYFNQTVFTLNTSSTSSCNTANNGTATVTAYGGAAPYAYMWSANPPQTTQTATGLAPGTYSITVSDSLGCLSSTTTVIVTDTIFTSTSNQADVSCFGMSNAFIAITPIGGTTPYTYIWSTNPVQTTSSVSNISAGNYACIITDATGCAQTVTFTIIQPTALTAAITSTPVPNGTAAVNSSGGTPPYTYLWNPAAAGQTTPIASGLSPGIYCCAITDANNCTNTICITIADPSDCLYAGEFYLPNGFSPNNDGENDVLKIYYGNIQCIESFKLVVYNRWGEKVFETANPSAEWNGARKGKTENAAVFVYYLDAALISGEKLSRKGNVSLIR